MSTPSVPPAPPIGLEFSVADHVARAEFFLANALQAQADLRIVNWLLMAAVYSARAPIEIVLTQYDDIYRRGDPQNFLSDAEKSVRRLKIIATVRVHDFHRDAVHLRPNAISMRGPVSMRTGAQSNSSVGLAIDPVTGHAIETKVRNASISYDRPLQTRGFEVLDFETDEFVPLPQALEEYLADLKPFLQRHFPTIKWA